MKYNNEKLLLEYYMLGFKDELDNKATIVPNDYCLFTAYKIGHADAIAGDDVMSINYRNDEQILEHIYYYINKEDLNIHQIL